jgi:tetratricopeptide (TPR) repeat protein
MNAHGDLSLRIEEKTIEISKDPNNSDLYLERGFLYQEHIEYDKAIQDYLKSQELGNTKKELLFRLAEVYYEDYQFEIALSTAEQYFKIDSQDVKIHKLKGQILFQLSRYYESLIPYTYFIDNTIDVRPEDIIEYSKIYLAIDSNDYTEAIKAINLGLDKIGEHTFSLQLKKLEYLESSNNPILVLEQYNYFILNNTRKEFWYFKKAKYLIEVNQLDQAKIALEQAKMAIQILNPKFKNTEAIKDLADQINNISKSITYEN